MLTQVSNHSFLCYALYERFNFFAKNVQYIYMQLPTNKHNTVSYLVVSHTVAIEVRIIYMIEL